MKSYTQMIFEYGQYICLLIYMISLVNIVCYHRSEYFNYYNLMLLSNVLLVMRSVRMNDYISAIALSAYPIITFLARGDV